MRIHPDCQRRRGQAVPLVAMFLFVGGLSVIALVIDLGLMAIARNQCQAAADMAALAGARCLNGVNNSASVSTAQTTATQVATSNSVLGNPITSANITSLTVGDYWYNSTRVDAQGNAAPGFDVMANGVATVNGTTDNYTLVQVQIGFTGTSTTPFGRMAGISAFNSSGIATAAHQPRDIVIVQDFSTSMRYDSMLGAPKNAGSARWQTMLAADQTLGGQANFPQFGHYSDVSGAQLSAATGQYPPTTPNNCTLPSGLSNLVINSSNFPTGIFGIETGELASPGNLVSDTNDGPKIANYFYVDPISVTNPSLAASFANPPFTFAISGARLAFSGATAGQGLSTPVSGDNFPYVNFNTSTGSFAPTVNDVLATSVGGTPTITPSPSYSSASKVFDLSWELDGYAGYYNGVNSLNSSHPLYNQTDYSDSRIQFKGYTQGPGYWGVTFFTWPPDPRTAPYGNSADPGFTNDQTRVNTIAPYLIQAIFGFDPKTGKNSAGTNVNDTYVKCLYGQPSNNFKGTKPNGGAGVNNWTDWYTNPSLGLTALQNYLKLTTGAQERTGAGPKGLGDNSNAPNYNAQPGQATQRYEMICRLFNRHQPAGPTNGTYHADWRARFFYNGSGTAPLTDNTKLWSVGTGNSTYNTLGQWLPSWDNQNNVYHQINYKAILYWLGNLASSTGAANPQPSGLATQLHSGGIQYYSKIPTSFSTLSSMTFPSGSFQNPSFGNISGGDTDEMFWMMYINDALGLVAQKGNYNGYSFWYNVICDNTFAPADQNPQNANNLNCFNGLGPDWTWTNTSLNINAPPTAPGSTSTPGLYMDYRDNPPRPKAKFWFGPMTMLDFIANQNEGRNWYSGACTEAPTFQCKWGVQDTLNYIKLNQPNDNVGLVFFSSSGQWSNAMVPLGRNYTWMTNAEWFTRDTINGTVASQNATAQANKEFTPFDGGPMGQVPCGNGGTSYTSGLMIAYNQFSTNSSLVSKAGGGWPSYAGGGGGRIGATKLLILESDGVNKDGANRNFNAPSGINSVDGWYNYFGGFGGGSGTSLGTPGSVSANYDSSGRLKKWTVTGASGPMSDAEDVVAQLCADQANGGFGTPRKPVLVNCIAFGSLFDPLNSGSVYPPNNSSNAPAYALQMMSNLEQMGGVQPVGGDPNYRFSSNGTWYGIAPYKIIYGPWNSTAPAGRIQLMRTAFTNILQQYGADVVLIGSAKSPATGTLD